MKAGRGPVTLVITAHQKATVEQGILPSDRRSEILWTGLRLGDRFSSNYVVDNGSILPAKPKYLPTHQ